MMDDEYEYCTNYHCAGDCGLRGHGTRAPLRLNTIDISTTEKIMEASNTKPAIVGTVCHGTTRPQDLIPAFMAAVANVDPDAYAQLVVAPFPVVPSWVYDEGDNCPWWDSEDATLVLESLTELLEAAAPEGWYFGAHPGDGSDFGYWELEE